MLVTLPGTLPLGCLACGPSLGTVLGMYAVIVGVPSLGLVAAGWACSVTSWESGRALGRALGRIGFGVTSGFALLGIVGAGVAGPDLDEILFALPFAVVFSALPLSCSAIAIRMNRRSAAPAYPVCKGCGYNLTGLIEARCPECGLRFATATKSEAERLTEQVSADHNWLHK